VREIVISLVLAGAAVLAALWLERAGAPLPMAIDADFPVCVTVKPAPLLRGPKGRMDYRTGGRFNDNGET